MTFGLWDAALIFLGALAGGFVNGLTGFGTGITAMPFWLLTAPPVIAAQLAAGCGLAGQLQTLPKIWRSIDWRLSARFVPAGLVGVPLGVWALPHIPIDVFKLGIGVLLIVFCAVMLLAGASARLSRVHPVADGVAGFSGGLLAGVAGLSGPIPTAWALVQDWTRDQKRALFQTFNAIILAAMLAASAVAGLMSFAFLKAMAIALFGTTLGVLAGSFIYGRLNTRGFDRVVLVVLLVSGVVIVAQALL
ncbi:MAG: sulfite exporter TauE/SafE family protein [Pseudomonadota bacterium]